MDTAQATRSLQGIAAALSSEVKDYGQSASGFNGAVVTSCFKNVTLIDLRMQLIELPAPLWDVYNEASMHPTRLYDPVDLANKINRIGAGTSS